MKFNRIRFSFLFGCLACVFVMGSLSQMNSVQAQSLTPTFYKCSGDTLSLVMGGVPIGDGIVLSGSLGNINGSAPVLQQVTIPGVGINVNVYVYPTYEYEITVDTCDSYAWHVRNSVYNTYTTSTEAQVNNPVTSTYSTGSGTSTITCDSIAKLHLTIRNSSTKTEIVSECNSYTWHGTTYTASTNTPTYHTTNAVGCDSTTTLDLTIRYSTYLTDNQTVCHSYRWQSPFYDTTYTYASFADTNEHVYIRNYTNADNCPSADTLHLRLFENDTLTELSTQVCDSLVWHGVTYTTSQHCEDVHPLVIGGVCDSVYQMHLDVYYSHRDTLTTPVEDLGQNCGVFYWHGYAFPPVANPDTTAYLMISSSHNCDSLVAMHIQVYPSHDSIEPYVLRGCGEYVYQPFGSPAVVFYHDTLHTIETLMIPTTDGCDSLVKVQIYVYPTYDTTIQVTACDHYVWANVNHLDVHGQPLSDSVYIADAVLGPVNYTLYHAADAICDSIVTLDLTVLPNDTIPDTLSSCFPIFYGNTTYTTSTVVYDTLPGATTNGCFRIGEHHIIIYNTADTFDTVHSCYYYDWHTVRHFVTTDTTARFATVHGCDSMVHMHIVIHDSITTHEVTTICGDTIWNGFFLPEVPGSVAVYDTTVYHLVNHWGCDSTAHITLTVKSHGYGDTNVTICDNFTWHGEDYTSDTTVVFRTRMAAVNGCDTVTRLHLTINHSTAYQLDTNVCDQFDFITSVPARGTTIYNHGSFTASDNTFSVNLENAVGCDSIVSLNLTVRYSSTGSETLESCDSLLWNGSWYNTSGDHVTTLVNAVGCDSITTLHLTIHNSHNNQDAVEACDSLLWINGITYRHNIATHPTFTLTDIYGCDSTLALYLTLHQSNHNGVDVRSACDSLEWHGTTYYNNNNTATYHTQTTDGCDSTVTLNLNIRHSVLAVVDTSVCDSVLWHTGVWYTASTTFVDTLTAGAVNQCDSISLVHLTVKYPVYTHVYDTACNSFTWAQNGQTYTAIGEARDTLSAASGCDSIIILHLHLTFGHDTIQNALNTIPHIACYHYQWHGVDYTVPGVYQNDSVDIYGCVHRQWLDLTIATTGNDSIPYAGCDSVSFDGIQYFYSDTVILIDVETTDVQTTSVCNINHWADLEVHHHSYTLLTQQACDTLYWTDGVHYGFGLNHDTVISVQLNNIVGCDSTVTLDLTIHHPSMGYDSVSACNSYYGTPLLRTFTQSFDSVINLSNLTGTAYRVNQYGCDSLLHQIVNIRQASSNRIDTVVCHGMAWNGQYYTNSIYGPISVSMNADGCRHTDTLNLTVYHPDTAAADVRTVCDSTQWRNAQYATTGTYYQTVYRAVHGVCDSVYVLQLSVYPTVRDTMPAGQCYQYNWAQNGGYAYTTSGLYTTTHSGVAAGGCDSILWLDLTIYHDTSEHVFDTVCDGVLWHGTYYNSTLRVPDRYYTTSVHGCDSVVFYHLTVHHADTATAHIYRTECGSYIWKGTSYHLSGVYRFDTITVHGCDSSVWLHLTINSYDTIDTTTINPNSVGVTCDSYTWNINGRSHVYTQSGTYYDTVLTAMCGQLYRLDLTIPESSSDIVTSVHCDSWVYNGYTYTADTLIESRRDVGGNHLGCDSIHYMQVVINHSMTVPDILDVCDSLVWLDGNTYRANNNTATYLVPGGREQTHCDSILALQLTVRNSSFCPDTLVGCDSRYWHLVGQIYYADLDTVVNYTALTGVQNAAGCDSIIAMHISVPTSSTIIDSIVNCGPYRWTDGVLYSTSIDGPTCLGTNQAGCDSTSILHLEVYQTVNVYDVDTVCDSTVWLGNTLTTSGFYFEPHPNVIGGVCDSLYYFDLTVYATHYAPVETVVQRNWYQWPRTGQWYRTSGDYYKVISNAVANHCDSVYTLHLELYGDSVATEAQTACSSYFWHGRNYTASGIYRDTVHNAVHGVADSIYILQLTLFMPDTLIQTVRACNEYVWTPDTLTASGTYFHYDRNVIGGVCDRVHRLNLTIQQTYTDSVMVSVCGGYDWRGSRYSRSGDYTNIVPRDAVNACDSIFKLHLIVSTEYNVVDNQTACDAFYWAPSNRTFMRDTTVVDTLYTVLHCDSIVTLNLHIEHSASRVSHRNYDACGSYTWPLTGRTYTASAVDSYSFSDGHTCDSTITMHLTIHPIVTTVLTQSACETYSWRGNTYTTSGSYFDTTFSRQGCDSILNLQLSVYQHHRNAVVYDTACDTYTWHGHTYTANTTLPTFDTLTTHGCDSTVNLRLTVYQSRSAVDTRVYCDSFTWHGTTYTASTNTPTYQTLTSEGCDSLVTLHLTINYSSSSILDTAVCTSLTWVDGNTYTASPTTPTYTYQGGNAVGCDSTVTLHLAIMDNGSVFDLESCDSIEWNGAMYYNTTSEVLHYINVAGCDSSVTYNLQIHPSATTVDTVFACDSVEWHGDTYTYQPVDAVYHALTVHGCDSAVVLDLTLNRSSNAVVFDTACDTYTWNGVTYTASTNLGDASFVTTNAVGCDSTTYLLLTINHSVETSFSDHAVDVYVWNGVSYNVTGAYVQTLTTVDGCDSVVTLNLVMIDFPMPQILVHNDRLLMVNHYPDGADYVEYYAYRWYRNNTLIPGATEDHYNHANYEMLSGCYYAEVPVDAAHSMWVPSNTICIGQGIDEVESLDFTLYPNPILSGSQVVVRSTVTAGTLTLYDQQGRQMMRHAVEGETTTISVDYPAGVYTLRMETLEGESVVKKLIIR